jgi:hypothetical protein
MVVHVREVRYTLHIYVFMAALLQFVRDRPCDDAADHTLLNQKEDKGGDRQAKGRGKVVGSGLGCYCRCCLWPLVGAAQQQRRCVVSF